MPLLPNKHRQQQHAHGAEQGQQGRGAKALKAHLLHDDLQRPQRQGRHQVGPELALGLVFGLHVSAVG